MNHYFLPVAAKKRTTYPVSFPQEVYNKMLEYCGEEERSIAWYVNKLVVEHLKSIGRLPKDFK